MENGVKGMEPFHAQISTFLLDIDHTNNSLNNFAQFLLRRTLPGLQEVVLSRAQVFYSGKKKRFMIMQKK